MQEYANWKCMYMHGNMKMTKIRNEWPFPATIIKAIAANFVAITDFSLPGITIASV